MVLFLRDGGLRGFVFALWRSSWFCRCELRAAADERVHDAVVPDAVRHVFTQADCAAGLGLRRARGVRDPAPNRAGHLERAARVSDGKVSWLLQPWLLAWEGMCLEPRYFNLKSCSDSASYLERTSRVRNRIWCFHLFLECHPSVVCLSDQQRQQFYLVHTGCVT